MSADRIGELDNLLDYMESHIKAGESFYGERFPPDLEGVYELYRETFDMALLLREKAEKGSDTPQEWEDLELLKGEASRAMAREGYRNWVQRGPTRSSLLNQIVYLCRAPELEEAVGSLAEMVNEAAKIAGRLAQEGGKQPWTEAMSQLADQLRDFDEDHGVRSAGELARFLDGNLAPLAGLLDLARFDIPAQPVRSWYESFVQLAEAYDLEEVDAPVLLGERDLARQRLEALANSTFALGSAGDNLAEIVLDLDETLLDLDKALRDSEDMRDWLDLLGGLWEEMERTLQQTAASVCSVCSHPLGPGDHRCPNCQNPVISLDDAVMAEPDPESTGSGLLDDLAKLRESFLAGKIDLEAWQTKLERTSRKVKAVLRSTAKTAEAGDAQGRAVKHLQSLQASLKKLAESAADSGAEQQAWEDVQAWGQRLVGELSKAVES